MPLSERRLWCDTGLVAGTINYCALKKFVKCSINFNTSLKHFEPRILFGYPQNGASEPAKNSKRVFFSKNYGYVLISRGQNSEINTSRFKDSMSRLLRLNLQTVMESLGFTPLLVPLTSVLWEPTKPWARGSTRSPVKLRWAPRGSKSHETSRVRATHELFYVFP